MSIYQGADDRPAVVPCDIAIRLPKFDGCGASQCNDHRYSSKDIDEMVSKGDDVIKKAGRSALIYNSLFNDKIRIAGKNTCWPATACRDCHRLNFVVGMHRLDCGHALCIECLVKRARRFCKAMLEPHVQHVVRAFFEAGDAYGRAADKARGDLDERRDKLGFAVDCYASAYQAADASCCDTPIEFYDFIPCLSPRDASAAWLASEEMGISEKRARYRCGWPDCRRYLPLDFMWEGWERSFGHCVACGGNSQQQGSDGDLMCPAR